MLKVFNMSTKVNGVTGNRKSKSSSRYKFSFIDLFAGIGGMRLAFESAGGKCVYSSEWDKFCQHTYEVNFGDKPDGHITKVFANKYDSVELIIKFDSSLEFSIPFTAEEIQKLFIFPE